MALVVALVVVLMVALVWALTLLLVAVGVAVGVMNVVDGGGIGDDGANGCVVSDKDSDERGKQKCSYILLGGRRGKQTRSCGQEQGHRAYDAKLGHAHFLYSGKGET